MEIIQRNERGRQGKARAQLLKELREEEKRRRIYDATDQLEMDPEIAAANIQVSRRFLLVPVPRALHREPRLRIFLWLATSPRFICGRPTA